MAKEAKQLLSHVLTINKNYDMIAEATGDYYNLFEILKIETNEVKHSAFIADLLDINGYHSQGDKFLRIFINVLRKLNKLPLAFPEFNYSCVKTEIEKFIGYTTYLEGGRIDILISDYSTAIVIENKIYAADQHNQLIRYDTYARKYKDYKILYLNLEGKAAENQDYDIEYINITYREVIIPWLEECIKECVAKPKIRESIAQYIQTIKYLSGMSTNDEKKVEIGKLIASSEEFIRAAQDILDSFNYAKAIIQFDFWKSMMDKLSTLSGDIRFNVTFEQVLGSYTNEAEYGIEVPLAIVNAKYEILLWVGLDIDKIPFQSYLVYDIKTGLEIKKDEMLNRNDESAVIQKILYELLPYENQWYWEYLRPEIKMTDSLKSHTKLQELQLIDEYNVQIEGILKRFKERMNSIFPGSVNTNLRTTEVREAI